MDYIDIIRKLVAWCLLATALFFLLTGFGISNQELVGPLTLGLLGKAVSFRIHEVLWAPFIVLLLIHVGSRFLPKSSR